MLNRLSNRGVLPGAGVAFTTTFETYQYDGLGRIVLANNDDSTVSRVYDSLSHVTTETQQVLPSGSVASVASTYDGVGNKLICTYPGGRAITNTYDALNRISIVRDELIAQYYYIGPSRVEQRDYGNGTRTLWQYDGIAGVANVAGDFGVQQITRTTHTNFLLGGLIDDRTYTWSRNAEKQRSVNALRPETRNYNYDPADRVAFSTWSSEGKNFSYNLDGAGNRTTTFSNGVATTYSESAVTPEPADRQMNQYTSTGGVSRQYDQNGNLTSVGFTDRLFTYDYRNQLADFADFLSDQTAAYKYNCFGQRIEKTSNSGTVRYYYDGPQIVEEQANGLTAATYVWGQGGELLTMARAGQNYYYHCDDLGSVRAVTDASGARVETYAYSDFGQPGFFNGSFSPIIGSAIQNPWLYFTRQYDAESGLTYWNGRNLDHFDGRSNSRISDAIWTPASPLGNPFTFANDNPLTDGLCGGGKCGCGPGAGGSGLFQGTGNNSGSNGTPAAVAAIVHFGGETNDFMGPLRAQNGLRTQSDCRQPADAEDLKHDVIGKGSSAALARSDAINQANEKCGKTDCSGNCNGGSTCVPWAVQYGEAETSHTGSGFLWLGTTYNHKITYICGCGCDK